ncbi:hypothetical protein TNCV_1272911 [Trichonephila clavipes]|nr:hypothetical protein TNCV_1272911 [Trichonephila clavipes]
MARKRAENREGSLGSPDAVLDPRHSRSDSQRAPSHPALSPRVGRRPSPHAPRRSRFEDLSSKPRTRKNSNARELPQRPAGASQPSANGWNRSTTTLAACIKAISWRPSSLAEKFSVDLHRMHHSVLGVPRSPPRSEEPPSIGLTDTSLRHTEDYLGVYSQIPCLVSQSAQQTTSIRGLSELIIAVPLVCPC